MMLNRIEFSMRQWRIFIGCFLAYFSTYLARLNLAAALSSLMSVRGARRLENRTA